METAALAKTSLGSVGRTSGSSTREQNKTNKQQQHQQNHFALNQISPFHHHAGESLVLVAYRTESTLARVCTWKMPANFYRTGRWPRAKVSSSWELVDQRPTRVQWPQNPLFRPWWWWGSLNCQPKRGSQISARESECCVMCVIYWLLTRAVKSSSKPAHTAHSANPMTSSRTAGTRDPTNMSLPPGRGWHTMAWTVGVTRDTSAERHPVLFSCFLFFSPLWAWCQVNGPLFVVVSRFVCLPTMASLEENQWQQSGSTQPY